MGRVYVSALFTPHILGAKRLNKKLCYLLCFHRKSDDLESYDTQTISAKIGQTFGVFELAHFIQFSY